MSFKHLYQRCKPITDKNIGKNLLKDGKKDYRGVTGAPRRRPVPKSRWRN
ncbi:hypothetical protein [Mesorhizobium sp. M1E.F.Ca.ET.063.01.1.1]|nr:hypothetical protein [Mesorhizobium sp. M1E.F.Ca.ET.063.01.1.1]